MGNRVEVMEEMVEVARARVRCNLHSQKMSTMRLFFFVLTGAKLVMGSHQCFIALLDFGALPNAVSFFSN